MNKKMGVMLSLALLVFLTSCAQKEKPAVENDYRVAPLEGGKSLEITGYTEKKQSVDIPARLHGMPVAGIGNNVFARRELISVTIPGSVTTIGDRAFSENFLITLNMGSNVTSIGERAFYKNQLTSVKIPNSVTTIGTEAFWDNKLTSVAIPNRITTIGDWAFQGNQITSVTIPNSVTTIGIGTFYNNQITSVSIPNSVLVIGAEAFAKNPLTNISIAQDNPTFVVRNFFLLSKDGQQVILYFGSEENVTIPDGVTTIAAGAFSAKELATVVIPESVTSIGDRAFIDNQLTSLTIGANVEIGRTTFDGSLNDYYNNASYDWNSGRYTYRRVAGTYTRRGNAWSRQ